MNESSRMRAAPASDRGTHQWTGRPWAARLVRTAVLVVPFTTSVASAFLLSKALPAAANVPWLLVRLIGIALAATVALKVVDRLMRRLLPLATLLDLTLFFPDEAPSRYKIALRNGAANVELQERIDRYTKSGRQDTAAAAEHLLDLVAALSRHDRITRGHSERVRAYAQLIGEEMGLSGRELDQLRWAALIHDVGKLRIPTEILNKPGKLTQEEFEVIKLHPEYGAELAKPLESWLGDAVLAVVQHHEKWDGSGYPRGLRGTEISSAGRIVAVADVFDVMTSVRSYKHACSPVDARIELAKCAGTHFDPAVVRAFMNLSLGRLRIVMGPLSWLAQMSLFPQSLFATAAPASVASSAGSAAGVSGVSAVSAASAASSVFGTAVTAAVGFAATSVGAVALPAEPVLADRPAAVEVAFDPSARSSEVSDAGAGVPSSTIEVLGLPGTPTTVVALPSVGGEPTTTPQIPIETTTTVPDPGSAAVATVPTTIAPTATAPAAPAPTAPVTTPVTPVTAATPATPATPATTATTVRPAAAPPATTTTTTTTLPPTTTTKLPPTTTTSTTTTTTTTTTTLPPTTTTAAPARVTNAYYLLASPAAGDRASQEVLPTRQGLPQQLFLPNYDTDRDNRAGLRILRGGALAVGDPTRMQRFAHDPANAVTFSGRHRVNVNVAADEGSDRAFGVIAALARCNVTTGACTVVLSGRADTNGDAGEYQLRTIDLGRADITLAAEERIEVWITVDGASATDVRLAYDAGWFFSGWQLD